MRKFFLVLLALARSLPLLAAEKRALMGTGTLVNRPGSTPLRNSVILTNREMIKAWTDSRLLLHQVVAI